MKFAGIARALTLVATLVVVGMIFAGVASSKPLSRPINMDSYAMAVDGTDVYWSEERRVKPGSYKTLIYRGSFLNRSKVLLARVAVPFGEQLAGLSAGGGYVVISLENDFFAAASKKKVPTSKVVRYARDGSRRTVMATGRIHTSDYGNYIIKNGVAYLDDCGTRVRALGVSDTGSVAIGRAVSDRRSKACGRKKDVDHWRYYEQRLDGSQREIISKDVSLRSKYRKINRGYSWSTNSGESAFSSIQLLGDRALIHSASSNQNFVRDLATGAFTGPFDLTPGTPEKYNQATLSDNGAVALSAYSFSRKTGIKTDVGVFPSAANPTVFTKSKSKIARQLLFCGSHLLSSPLLSRKLQEVDPVTFAPIRTLATLKRDEYIISEGEFGCDSNYVYGIKFTRTYSGSLLAFPLK